jgi:hypothetical protein
MIRYAILSLDPFGFYKCKRAVRRMEPLGAEIVVFQCMLLWCDEACFVLYWLEINSWIYNLKRIAL